MLLACMKSLSDQKLKSRMTIILSIFNDILIKCFKGYHDTITASYTIAQYDFNDFLYKIVLRFTNLSVLEVIS